MEIKSAEKKFYLFDITARGYGKCYTKRTADPKISSNMAQGSISIQLNNALQYEIFFHDPEYFFLTLNPSAIPGLRLIVKPTNVYGEARHDSIEIIERNNMNVENMPCNEDKNYSLSSCIRKDVESKVGCRMPWKGGNGQSCSTVQHFSQYQILYEKLALMEIGDVTNLTNCPLPCSYRIIRFVGNPKIFPNSKATNFSSYSINLVSTNIVVETEELIYSFSNLVSDIGGSLGLFLGFSFLMIWDWIIISCDFLKTFFRPYSK